MDEASISKAGPAHSSGASPQVRVAYLLSRYPAISHTFFLHEVLGLRARGLHLETASINPPDRPLADLPVEEAAEAAQTFYIKGTPRSRLVRDLLGAAFGNPGVVLRGLRTVLALRGLTLRQRLFWLFYLCEALLVGQWMHRRQLTHLHVHFGGPVASVGMLVAAAWNLPYSLTIHGPEELLNVDAYQLPTKIQRARFVVCISDFCRSQLYQLTSPAEWNKFHVVRLGVDPLALAPSGRTPASTTLELVCTGRLVAAKGHHILLQALVLLREEGLHLHTTLIGSGPEREGLEHFVAQHQLSDAVTFTSALSHGATLERLRRADLFCLASFAEGIPVALMEAMSLGLPCVSTTIAGIPELIESGTDGLLVPPANPEALASALRLLLQDPVLRQRLGSAARARILRQYTLATNQQMLAAVFENNQSTPATSREAQ